jgi:hypothetical protein
MDQISFQTTFQVAEWRPKVRDEISDIKLGRSEIVGIPGLLGIPIIQLSS